MGLGLFRHLASAQLRENFQQLREATIEMTSADSQWDPITDGLFPDTF